MYNNPYFNPMNTYIPNQNMYKPLEQPIQQSTTTYVPPVQPIKPTNLLGRMVDSVDTVKGIEYPLDGSVSYFPTTDGTAIVTKQLMQDGTSKTTIYKPVIEDDKKEDKQEVKYLTIEDLQESLKTIDLSGLDDIKDELKELRRELDGSKSDNDFKKQKKRDD